MAAVRSARAERISNLYDLKQGDHIKVNEIFYSHHMIVVRVVGETTIRVIHSSKEAGVVEEKVVKYTPEEITLLVYECLYSRREIIERAREHIGESYNLFWSNCEHFATEVRTGEKQSLQVQTGVAIGVGAAIGVGLLAAAGLWYFGQKDKKTDSDSDSESDSDSYSKRGTRYQYP